MDAAYRSKLSELCIPPAGLRWLYFETARGPLYPEKSIVIRTMLDDETSDPLNDSIWNAAVPRNGKDLLVVCAGAIGEYRVGITVGGESEFAPRSIGEPLESRFLFRGRDQVQVTSTLYDTDNMGISVYEPTTGLVFFVLHKSIPSEVFYHVEAKMMSFVPDTAQQYPTVESRALVDDGWDDWRSKVAKVSDGFSRFQLSIRTKLPPPGIQSPAGIGDTVDSLFTQLLPKGLQLRTRAYFKGDQFDRLKRQCLFSFFERVMDVPSQREGSFLLSFSDVSTAGSSNSDGLRLSDRPKRAVPCPDCESTFGRKYEMHRHWRTVHGGQKPFRCEECGKDFTHASHVRVHMQAVHERRRDHKCAQCPRAFSTKYKLDRHRRSVHEQERRFKCELCDNEYFQKSDLQRHYRIHHDRLE